jgi:hypothetical protein
MAWQQPRMPRLCAKGQRKARKGTRYAFQFKQLALKLEASTITAERTARSNHAVAWNDDGYGVAIVRHAYGAESLRMADGARDISIAASFSIGDFKQGIPARKLKWRAAKIKWKRKFAALSGKVFIECTQVGSECRFGFDQLLIAVDLLHPVMKLKPHQAFRGCRQK